MRDGCMAGVWHDSPCSAAAGLSPDTPKLTALYNEAVELDGRSTLDGLEMDQISSTVFASVMLRYELGVGSSSPPTPSSRTLARRLGCGARVTCSGRKGTPMW
jgi:hypothetical protein